MILPRINKNCSKYQAIELIFQKTGDCMKRFFILSPFAFFSFRNCWVRITVDGKSGWISGAYLSAERGGPTYYISEDWIAFHNGDTP